METLIRPNVGPIDLCWGLAKGAAEYGLRRCARAVARSRMRRLRRNPTDLIGRLQRARRVLIVCHGNIIRSPFAAQLLRQTLGTGAAVSIRSAGLEASPGTPSHPIAIEVAIRRHVDLTRHAASRLTPEVVAESDVIFVMDVPQLVALGRRFPGAGAKTFLLASLEKQTLLEVHDPVDGDEGVFQVCFNHISRAARPIARELIRSSEDQ